MEENERIAIIETEQKSMKADIHSLFKKTDEINQMATAIALLTSSVNDLKTTVSTLNTKLDVTSSEPVKEKAKNWEATIKWAFAIVSGIIIGVVVAKLTGK